MWKTTFKAWKYKYILSKCSVNLNISMIMYVQYTMFKVTFAYCFILNCKYETPDSSFCEYWKDKSAANFWNFFSVKQSEEKELLILASVSGAATVVLAHNNKQKQKRKKKRLWARDCLLQRPVKGSCNGTLSELRLNDKEDFRKLLRMNTETFQVYSTVYYFCGKEKYKQWKQKQAISFLF